MKNIDKKEIGFRIFSGLCIFLTVVVFAMLRRLDGDPTFKMLTTILVIFLLTVLNVAVIFLYELYKNKNNKE